MEIMIVGILILSANYLGYVMGKGKDISIILPKVKKAVRSEEQEAAIIDKIYRENKVKLNG